MITKRTRETQVITILNESVHNLHHDLYPEVFKKFSYEAMYEYFAKVVDEENHHFIICEENNTPIGYIWFEEVIRDENAFSYRKHHLYINQVSVNKEHRGKGAGTLLFNEALKFAVEKSIKSIALDYWAKNESAKKIYKNLGFEIRREVAYLEL